MWRDSKLVIAAKNPSTLPIFGSTPQLSLIVRAPTGTPGKLARVSGKIWRCGLVHMKAGSILSAWLNFWIWIISFRIFGYVSLYPLRYDKTYLTIWIRVLRFDGLSRMLPAFICTNSHFNILPETPTSPSGVPAWARNRAVFKRGVVQLILHVGLMFGHL